MDMTQPLSTGQLPQLPPPRSQTWQDLLIQAERLFAERGIDGVSLRQVVSASGQRNPAAVQYHFGNKEGLIRAILQQRVPVFNRRRTEMLDALETNGEIGDVRQILAAVAVPLLEFGPSSGYYVRFLARLTEDRELSTRLFGSLDEETSGGGRRVNEALHSATSHLPDRVREQRIRMALNLITGELARRATSAEAGHSTIPADIFLDDLLDAAVGLIGAPVSRNLPVARRQQPRPSARGK
jgi:AcrR family transcriptional regulator